MSIDTNHNGLHIDHLSVTIDECTVLHEVSLHVTPGTLHLIMGKNGSGKSSLGRTIMGDPACAVTNGAITYHGDVVHTLSADKRARKGIFLAFQNPCTIPGVGVLTLLKEAYDAQHTPMTSVSVFKEFVIQQMLFLGMDPALCERTVNEGFSGGEKKKLELLQLLILRPTCSILDEIDSGLDIDALKLVTKTITTLMTHNPSSIVVVITHNPELLEQLTPDAVHVMTDGRLSCSGDRSLLSVIKQRGYDAFPQKF